MCLPGGRSDANQLVAERRRGTRSHRELRVRGHRSRLFPMAYSHRLMSINTTALQWWLAMAEIARDVKSSVRTSFNRDDIGQVGTPGGQRERMVAQAALGHPRRKRSPSFSGWEDHPESRHSMIDASSPLRCSRVAPRLLPSRSSGRRGSEPLMSVQDPAGSPSFGLLTTRRRVTAYTAAWTAIVPLDITEQGRLRGVCARSPVRRSAPTSTVRPPSSSTGAALARDP